MTSTPKTAFENNDNNGSGSGSNTPHHFFPSGRRLKHFFHPGRGRKIHVASSPDEVTRLSRTISQIEETFDIVVHGSPEHLEYLREAHSHHEQRRLELRGQNVADWDEMEHVVRELDHMANELQQLSEHAISLDANFSKFGYSAHVRVKDSPNASRTSLDRSASSESGDGESTNGDNSQNHGKTMAIFAYPTVRQYFHKGLLWRSEEEFSPASYELFFDLLYVGILAVSGDSTVSNTDAPGQALLRFFITFTMAWKVWSDLTLHVGWLDSDDVFRRVSILFLICCLLSFTFNIEGFFDDTYTPLVASYLTARLFSAAFLLFVGVVLLPMVRGAMILHFITTIVPCALWIGSIHVEEPGRQALIWPALVLDLFGSAVVMVVQLGKEHLPGRIGEIVRREMDFYPALNIEHKIERLGAFVSLVIGYAIVGSIYQNSAPAPECFNDFFGKALLGLVQAFAIAWIYFEIDAYNVHTHAIRRSAFSSVVYLTVHLPLAMGLILNGAALSRMILATDTPGSTTDDLIDEYAAKSEPAVTQAQRWFYCAGLATALASMAAMSASHVHKPIPYQRLRKSHRLAVRLSIALIILLLPLAPASSLDSLSMIAITTCLVVLVLAADVTGVACAHDPLWMTCRGGGRYATRCKLSQKDVENSVLRGEKLCMEEVARRNAKRGGGGDGSNEGRVMATI